ncbi:PR domain zinc finger protein 5 isoform X4 [Agrilus planipennis]|uniref:PR domain zinc finger protein 5 isoform X4 n=1 Tax=Agrilus planipennis TaxID=224129 RepID=A0A1W4XSB4_AGRPL|nr:PR domain zinc finger protein 5 isoform X4 [Agrilus planipennis]
MVNSVELMQLCRLCLVKDEVNIPIFDNETDVQQIFLKISTCLPVKVTQDDNLPKKICNDCSYKLDLCYQFWNTSANSEKQLVTWLNEVGLSQETLNEAKLQKTESNSTPGLVLKQETIEPESESSHEVVNNVSTESQEYILQQQQLPYQTPAFPFTDDNFVSGESANAGASKTHTNNKRESTLKRKRQAVATVTQPDSDDDVDEDIDDPTETKVAKTEETSDDDRDDDGLNDEESTEFAGVPSTSTDNEQPGPSGIGKNVVDAPLQESSLRRSSRLSAKKQNGGSGTSTALSCRSCLDIFASLAEYKEHKKFHKTLAAIALKQEDGISDETENIRRATDESSKDSAQSSDESYESESEYEVSENSSASDSDAADESQTNEKTSNKRNVTLSKEQLRSDHTIEVQNTNRDVKINQFNCNYCSWVTKTSAEMVKHLEKSHLNKRCFTCTSCPGNAFTFEELQNHFKNFHRKSSALQMTSTKSINSDSTDSGDCLVVANVTTPSQKEKTVNKSSNQKKIDLQENNTMKRNHFETRNNRSTDLTGSKVTDNTNNVKTNSLEKTNENDNDKAICCFCEMKFKQPVLLKNHLKSTHNKEGPFKCAVCPKEYAGYTSLDVHFAKQHTGKKFKCYQCGKGFDSKEEVILHRNEHHRNYCDICQTYFSIPRSDHNQRVHAGERIKCTICDKTCKGKKILEIHMRRVHPRVLFPCSVCGKEFKSRFTLKLHHNGVHTEMKTTVCQVCGKDVKVNYLHKHLNTHKNNKKCCKICKKPYKSDAGARGCEDKHNNYKRYKCTICDKSYFSYASLTIHRRLHTGEKPYSCSVCSRSFYTAHILYKHSLSH